MHNQTQECTKGSSYCPSIDGAWSKWTRWSPCSKTCGGRGKITRERKCNNPSPQFGGLPCKGKAEQYRPCFLKRDCPVLKPDASFQTETTSQTKETTVTDAVNRNCSIPPPRILGFQGPFILPPNVRFNKNHLSLSALCFSKPLRF